MKIKSLVTTLLSNWPDPLPGSRAQQAMLARPLQPWQYPGDQAAARLAAVLILLFPRNEEVRFFLTERTDAVEHHKGQIALPGGAWEAGESLYETALRETSEETGIPTQGIRHIGDLSALYIPVTGFLIHPFVAWLDHEPAADPDPREVRCLFSMAIPELVNNRNRGRELRRIRGYEVQVPFFRAGRRKIWGATAMILSEFVQILKTIPTAA